MELLPGLGRRAERRKIEVGLIRGAVVKARMWSLSVVQQGLRTPTGPFFARFFIGIIPGLVAKFTFVGLSTRLVMLFFAARWMGRKQTVGWRFQHGCSTGRHAVTPSFWQLSRLSASTRLQRFLRFSIWR
ncbi:hypothetical protein [Bradyrhizobium sp. 142]|uniref:hypothetical protein n=1 Tax=Bradyrhizobium sp. 142 TaxID=2782618 RepID=UPI001FFA3EE1|nr:hypothetical protein [Bradyrhizobium sp. 142]MCK1724546.1 hypothetical protein [Bradyrhizobium sp. 142]